MTELTFKLLLNNYMDAEDDKINFEKTILDRTLDQGSILASLIDIGKEKIDKLKIIESKIDRLEKQVEKTNGTVRDLMIDMGVVKARHEAEDALRKELTDALNNLLSFLKKWATNIFWVLFTGISITIIMYIWNHLFPTYPFPHLPGVNY